MTPFGFEVTLPEEHDNLPGSMYTQKIPYVVAIKAADGYFKQIRLITRRYVPIWLASRWTELKSPTEREKKKGCSVETKDQKGWPIH